MGGRQGLPSAPRALGHPAQQLLPLPPAPGSLPVAPQGPRPGGRATLRAAGACAAPGAGAGRVGLASSSCREAAPAPRTWQRAMAASITRQELAQISGMVRGGGRGRGGSWVCNACPGLGWPRGRPAGAGAPRSGPAQERAIPGPAPAAGRTDRASQAVLEPHPGPWTPSGWRPGRMPRRRWRGKADWSDLRRHPAPAQAPDNHFSHRSRG